MHSTTPTHGRHRVRGLRAHRTGDTPETEETTRGTTRTMAGLLVGALALMATAGVPAMAVADVTVW